MKNKISLLFIIFLIINIFSINHLFSKSIFEVISPARFSEEDKKILGYHEKFDTPEGMFGQMQNKLRQSADRVLTRFVKKKHSLGQYPGKAIKGMGYFEVLYNELLYDPAFEVDLLKDINKGRQSFRDAFGFSSALSITEATYRYWTLGDLLDQGKVDDVIVEKDLLERKVLLRDLKNRIGNLRTQVEFDTSIKVVKTTKKKDVKEDQQTDDGSSMYSGYCLRDDGSVYGTIYKNNCLENKEITFEQYTNNLNNSSGKEGGSEVEESNLETIEEKLRKIKRFYEEGLITIEEYDSKRLEILDAF